MVINYAADQASAESTATRIQELGVKAITVQADVAKVTDVARLFETALSAFGRIDIVVANAGLELTGLPVLDFTEDQFDRMFSVNTKGVFFTMQAAARHVSRQRQDHLCQFEHDRLSECRLCVARRQQSCSRVPGQGARTRARSPWCRHQLDCPHCHGGSRLAHPCRGRRADQQVHGGFLPDGQDGESPRPRRCGRVSCERLIRIRQRPEPSGEWRWSSVVRAELRDRRDGDAAKAEIPVPLGTAPRRFDGQTLVAASVSHAKFAR